MEEATTETKIKKASLKDDALEIEYDEIINDPEQGPVINTFKLKGGNRPHDDLKKAFEVLRFHTAMICEQVPPCPEMTVSNKKKEITAMLNALHDHEIVKAITVSGFTIGGSDENEGVTLIGQRALKSGQVLNLVAPFTKWESDYKYAADLYPEVAVAIQECLEYLKGKYAPNPQLELSLDKKVGEPQEE